jgi:CMP/dCMP kinase
MSIITITGDLASGKSLVAKQMAKEIGAEYFSTGLIQREIAAKYGMTTLELNKYSESHPEIDQEIDDRVRQLSDSDRALVVDSRMAWYFLPKSFKVYLATNIVRAAERVIADTERSNEPVYQDRNDAMLKLKERKRSENKRYLQLYNADCAKLSNFDLVVDTTYSVPNDTIGAIMAALEDWRRNIPVRRYWYSPRSILPLRSWQGLEADPLLDRQQPVPVLMCNGELYVYSGHGTVFDALQTHRPYLPVEIIAEDEQPVREGGTATHYLESAFKPEILSAWEQRFGFEYLALSGRFGERVG